MKEIGIGVVGLGYAGRFEARVCSQIPGTRVVGVVTRTAERGQAVANRLGCEFYPTVDELLQRDDLDGVVVATPNDLHLEPVVKACKRGKHVFVEKPMALSTRDCDEMIGAAREAGVYLMVGHMMRFYDAVLLTKQIVESGKIGRPMVAHCERTGWEPKKDHVSWKKIQARSGGHLFHHIHEIDLMQWFFGEVDKVYCFGDNLGHVGPDFGDEDDVILLTMRFRNGAFGSMHYGSGFRFGDHFVRLSGDIGGIMASHRTGQVFIRKEGEPDKEIPFFEDPDSQASLLGLFEEKDLGIAYGSPEDDPPVYLARAMNSALSYWIDAMRGAEISGDMKAIMDGTAGRTSVEIAEAALLSMKTGKPVQLPLR